MRKYIEKLNRALINEESRREVQFRIIATVFCIVAFGMTILNIITKNWALGISTAAFCFLCFTDIVIERRAKDGLRIATTLFSIELIALFSYFVITGGVDNFSTIWLVLLPAIGISFFGMKKGSLISAIVLVIMILCFYVPPFRDFSTQYNSTFRNRFPIIYVSAYILAMIMDYIRMISAEEIIRLQKRYEHLSMHDELTNIKNRHGMSRKIEELKARDDLIVAEAMFDLDFFKKINDEYGHEAGDLMLRGIADVAKTAIPSDAEVFRWGGEEFVVIFDDANKAKAYCEKLLVDVRTVEYDLGKAMVHETISIGLAISDKPASETDFAALLIKADGNLYKAKEAGRNCVVY